MSLETTLRLAGPMPRGGPRVGTECCAPGDIILLSGTLGRGKTTFASEGPSYWAFKFQ